jgi:phage gpG-like protein
MFNIIVKEKIPKMRLGWWKPTKQEWTPILQADQKPFWQMQLDPTTGRAWAKLTPRYYMQKQKHYPGQPTLRATGLMQDSMQITTQDNRFIVNTTYYGAYQQFGTPRMVARPWVGVPYMSLQKIVPIAWKNILR